MNVDFCFSANGNPIATSCSPEKVPLCPKEEACELSTFMKLCGMKNANQSHTKQTRTSEG